MKRKKGKTLPKIKIVKNNSSEFQLTNISSAMIEKLRDKFSYLPAGYKYNPKFRILGIKGVKVSLVKRDGTFSPGLFDDVVRVLSEDYGKKVLVSKEVKEHFLDLTDFFSNGIESDVFSEYGFDLRDYQHQAVEKTFALRQGLLNLSTGAGKCLCGDTKLQVKMPKELIQKYKHLIN